MRIGIDYGGTKIEGVCISSRGEITVRRRVETPRSEGYDAIIRRIVELVAELERECGEGGSVGIGHAGSESKIVATL